MVVSAAIDNYSLVLRVLTKDEKIAELRESVGRCAETTIVSFDEQ